MYSEDFITVASIKYDTECRACSKQFYAGAGMFGKPKTEHSPWIFLCKECFLKLKTAKKPDAVCVVGMDGASLDDIYAEILGEKPGLGKVCLTPEDLETPSKKKAWAGKDELSSIGHWSDELLKSKRDMILGSDEFKKLFGVPAYGEKIKHPTGPLIVPHSGSAPVTVSRDEHRATPGPLIDDSSEVKEKAKVKVKNLNKNTLGWFKENATWD